MIFNKNDQGASSLAICDRGLKHQDRGHIHMHGHLRIDNSGWSVNCTAPINEVWTGCSQRVYYILHIFR